MTALSPPGSTQRPYREAQRRETAPCYHRHMAPDEKPKPKSNPSPLRRPTAGCWRTATMVAAGVLALLTACAGSRTPAPERSASRVKSVASAPRTRAAQAAGPKQTAIEALRTSLETKTVLQWNQQEKILGFPRMEEVVPARTINKGASIRPFKRSAAPFEVSFDVDGETWSLDDYVKKNLTAGLLIIFNEEIVYENYGLGHSANGRWTSFSVAKSFSSTMVGAAIKDGKIQSLDDPVTRYLPALTGSAYDGVTVRQVLTMTSGVRWNEDYTDPKSDVSRFIAEPSTDGSDPTVTYMARLPREAEPGTKWVYKTGETNLVGSLVEAATGKKLAEYLSAKVWSRIGMEQDGSWLLNASGREIAGCCVSAALRDYGRFGVFFMNGAKVDGESIVPDGWIDAATTSTEIAQSAMGGRAGYGFQWWTTPGPAYRASGIYGQGIWLNPELNLVVVTQSAWDKAIDRVAMKRRAIMIDAVERVIRDLGSKAER